jgi:adenylosuccinate synthase
MGIAIGICLFYGDTGKGEVGDLLTQYAQITSRAHGAPNSGQTEIQIIDNVRHDVIRHNLPIGTSHEQMELAVIGAGCLVDPSILQNEFRLPNGSLDQRVLNMLKISERAHLILPHHILQDIQRETSGKGVGSTRRGVSGASQDRAYKIGLRFVDLKSEKHAKYFIGRQIEERNLEQRFPDHKFDPDEIFRIARDAAGPIMNCVCNTSHLLTQELDKGKNLYIGGNQGALLDWFHGSVPNTTSNPTTAASMLDGLGIGLRPAGVVGIIKANATRVGGGPFTSQLVDYDMIMQDVLEVICSEAGITPEQLDELDATDPVAAGNLRKKYSKSVSLSEDELYIIENSRLAHAYVEQQDTSDEFPDHDPKDLYHKVERIKQIIGTETPRKRLNHIIGKYQMIRGAEFGASTGRPRRQGALDIPALKHAVRINNPTCFALTKLDVLQGIDPIPICVGYNITVNGRSFETDIFPADLEELEAAEPIWDYLPGFDQDITSIDHYYSLPRGAIEFVHYIEKKLGRPVDIVGTGKGKDKKIVRGNLQALYK